MFKDSIFEINLFASDKVPASDESTTPLVGRIYSNNIIGLSGINASGKTTALALIELAAKIIEGSLLSGGGLPSTIATFFDNSSTFKCPAYGAGICCLVESKIICEGEPTSGVSSLAFDDEHISIISAKTLRRTDLLSWKALGLVAKPLYHRAQMAESWLVIASPEVSISGVVIAKESGGRRKALVFRDDKFSLKRDFIGLDTVLRVFDPTIEHLEIAADGKAFSAKFKGREAMILSENGLEEVLSSGTFRGIALIGRAISALQSGGYLLIDEIENHLNRQLVNVILDLFVTNETNPMGATLVFTTHYPQLLDHIHRKDNVYFLASTYGNGSKIIKYCTQVKRIENKKSEVFVSNFVKGTAPRYIDVKSLKSLVASEVASNVG